MDKIVKCNRCGQYFMHTTKDTKCPFCHTEYVEVAKKEDESKFGDKHKKETTKTQKKSFKIWKN